MQHLVLFEISQNAGITGLAGVNQELLNELNRFTIDDIDGGHENYISKNIHMNIVSRRKRRLLARKAPLHW